MKYRLRVAVCVFMVSLFALCSERSEAGLKNEYKMSVNISETTPQGIAVAHFVDLVKERTDGRINIKIYWNGQLFSGRATNELLLMKKNIGDFSLSSFINWAPQYPAGNIFLLPWFISSMPDKYKALDALESGKAGNMIENDIAEKFGLKVLAWGEQGSRELSNNTRRIKTPEDMKDVKFRVVGSPLFIEIFKALGANPMNISWGEALTALQQHIVDGQENPYSVYLPNKIYEFQKYLTEWGYTMDPLIYVVNRRIWQSFPEDIQKIISEAALECGRYNKALSRLGLDDGDAARWLKEHDLYPTGLQATDPRKFVENNGVEVTVLSPNEIKAFREKVEPVYDEWVGKVGSELVEAAQNDMNKVQY